MEYKELPDEVCRALKRRNRVPSGVSLDGFACRFQEALRKRMIKRKSLREELLERIWFVLNFNPRFRFSLVSSMACALLLFLLGSIYFISNEANFNPLGATAQNNVKYVTVDIDSPNIVNHETQPSIYDHDTIPKKLEVRYVSAHEPYLADASLAF